MDAAPCRLLGELRYPDEYSYERVGTIESELGDVLEEVLEGLELAHLEVMPGPEGYGFEAWCEGCSPAEAWNVCEALLAVADDGPFGRLVVLRGLEEAILVYYFQGEKIDEVTLERP